MIPFWPQESCSCGRVKRHPSRAPCFRGGFDSIKSLQSTTIALRPIPLEGSRLCGPSPLPQSSILHPVSIKTNRAAQSRRAFLVTLFSPLASGDRDAKNQSTSRFMPSRSLVSLSLSPKHATKLLSCIPPFFPFPLPSIALSRSALLP